MIYRRSHLHISIALWPHNVIANNSVAGMCKLIEQSKININKVFYDLIFVVILSMSSLSQSDLLSDFKCNTIFEII
jgi:hypothetical protein